MTQISLSNSLALIDQQRGEVLKQRREYEKGSAVYSCYSEMLRRLNRLKKELALVSDSDQLSLGM